MRPTRLSGMQILEPRIGFVLSFTRSLYGRVSLAYVPKEVFERLSSGLLLRNSIQVTIIWICSKYYGF